MSDCIVCSTCDDQNKPKISHFAANLKTYVDQQEVFERQVHFQVPTSLFQVVKQQA